MCPLQSVPCVSSSQQQFAVMDKPPPQELKSPPLGQSVCAGGGQPRSCSSPCPLQHGFMPPAARRVPPPTSTDHTTSRVPLRGHWCHQKVTQEHVSRCPLRWCEPWLPADTMAHEVCVFMWSSSPFIFRRVRGLGRQSLFSTESHLQGARGCPLQEGRREGC